MGRGRSRQREWEKVNQSASTMSTTAVASMVTRLLIISFWTSSIMAVLPVTTADVPGGMGTHRMAFLTSSRIGGWSSSSTSPRNVTVMMVWCWSSTRNCAISAGNFEIICSMFALLLNNPADSACATRVWRPVTVVTFGLASICVSSRAMASITCGSSTSSEVTRTRNVVDWKFRLK